MARKSKHVPSRQRIYAERHGVFTAFQQQQRQLKTHMGGVPGYPTRGSGRGIDPRHQSGGAEAHGLRDRRAPPADGSRQIVLGWACCGCPWHRSGGFVFLFFLSLFIFFFSFSGFAYHTSARAPLRNGNGEIDFEDRALAWREKHGWTLSLKPEMGAQLARSSCKSCAGKPGTKNQMKRHLLLSPMARSTQTTQRMKSGRPSRLGEHRVFTHWLHLGLASGRPIVCPIL